MTPFELEVLRLIENRGSISGHWTMAWVGAVWRLEKRGLVCKGGTKWRLTATGREMLEAAIQECKTLKAASS